MFLLKQSVKHFPRIFSTDAKCIRTTPISLSIIGKRLIQLSPDKQENKTIVVPPLAESVTEGDVRVEKKVGDNVKTDEVIMEIETDKTSVPIPAPAPGVITELLVKDGDTVKPGQALFKMDIGATVPGKPVEKAPPPPTAAPPAISPKVEAKVATRPEQRVKMNKMRIMIAKRLKDAQNTAALLTTFSEIDMLALTKLKNDKHDEFLNKHKIKLGFMSAFLKASSVALKEMPEVNAVIDKNEIIYREYIDISVAVATSKGLIVPVVKNVDKLSFENTELELNKLAELAKSNSLTVDSVLGGTFTIDNGGVFGSLMSTQIINQPQSAIMGMHKIIERPVAIKGKIEIRPMMFVSLTYDHRLIDGREAVLFLRKVKSCIEDPVSIAK